MTATGEKARMSWDEDLKGDAEALEYCVKREERRSRRLRALEVEDVQELMRVESDGFARVLAARRKLLALLDGRRNGGGGDGRNDGRNYVIKHRQEGHIDSRLVTMYEALWLKTYGSEAGYIGDPNALNGGGLGGNQSRMKESGERVYRAGAKGGGPGAGGSRRSIIKDERAFNFKRKIDKRMRRLAGEIEEWLREMKVGGVEVIREERVPRCGDCQRFIEREWRFCASCGARKGV